MYNSTSAILSIETRIIEDLAGGFKTGKRGRVKAGAEMLSLQQSIDADLQAAYRTGARETARDLSRQTGKKIGVNVVQLTSPQYQAILNETNEKYSKVVGGVIRQADLAYRRIEHDAKANLKAGMSKPAAIDKASKNFLSRGLTLQVGDRQLNAASYSEMVMRTTTDEVTRIAGGNVRKMNGVSLILISQYSGCSETCFPWQGRVYNDDVYSGGVNDDRYPKLSIAINGSLFHPNCRHHILPYIENVTETPELFDETETRVLSDAEKKQRYNERNIRMYKRLTAGSIDPVNIDKYGRKVAKFEARQRALIKQYPDLNRDYTREGAQLDNALESIG